MPSFNSFSIRYKILMIVSIALLGLVANLGFSYVVTSNNKARLDLVRVAYLPILEKIAAAQKHMSGIKDALKTAANIEDEDLIKEDADKLAKSIKDDFAEMVLLDPEVSDAVKKLEITFTAYYKSARYLTMGIVEDSLTISDIQLGSKAMANDLINFNEQLEAFRIVSYDHSVNSLAKANETAGFNLIIGFIISVVTLIVVTLIGIMVSNMVVKNILAIVNSLKEIASGEGDLTRRLKASGDDEIGELVKYFNKFIEKLQNIISNVAGSTTQLATASEEMSQVSGESNNNAAKQATETEQVATAINEMTITVKEVSENAQEAATSAQEATAAADKGQSIVKHTVTVINSLAAEVEQAAGVIQKLEEDTETIGSVLDVIRGISEQTNLLALNAAIEAARAGEQGRGFAVVADEVRTLAGRTQEATTEIQAMIESLQTGAAQAVAVMNEGKKEAQASVTQAAAAGESLAEINIAILSIRDMNTHIASAAEELGCVTEEINQNISAISEIGTETSQGAQQTASASKEMSQLATSLQTEVGQFKT